MLGTIAFFVLNALEGGFKVYFLVLLPVLYSAGIIDVVAIGYLGASFVVALMAGAATVSYILHNTSSLKTIRISVAIGLIASTILLFGYLHHNVFFIAVSYMVMGYATGLLVTTSGAIAGMLTKPGARFHRLAQLAMIKDVVRILVPALLATLVAIHQIPLFIAFIALSIIAVYVCSFLLPHLSTEAQQSSLGNGSLFKNKNFLRVVLVEFLDSVASAPLFVFVPLIFLARGYSVSDSIILQSAIFAGYLIGRWFIALLSSRWSGWRAVGIAELGMAGSIVILLLLQNYYVLLFMCIILGVFTRGTSPAIKALAFDTLSQENLKRGNGIFVVAGDGGSAVGQMLFGFLAAWLGFQSPFWTAVIIVLTVAGICFARVTASSSK